MVCGPDIWLYYHGYSTAERHRDLAAFYADPAGNGQVLEKYGVEYILVSSHERHDYTVNTEALDAGYPLVYDQGGIRIYGVETQNASGTPPDAEEEGNG